MTVKKNNKKPVFVISINDTDTVEDILATVAYAKAKNGVALDKAEFNTLVKTIAECIFDIFDSVLESTITMLEAECEAPVKEKKPNIFKRFWNWLTRKNKK